MMRISFLLALLAACGSGSGSSGNTQALSVTALSNVTGNATRPADLQIASATSFAGAASTATWNVAAADLAPFTGAVIASLAVPTTYGGLLTVFAQAASLPPAQTTVTVTDSGAQGDCALDFASGALATATSCTVDLFGRQAVYPGPASLALTGTLNQGNVNLTYVDIGINEDLTARGVVWFQRGTLARLTQPATGHLGAISAPAVAGDILLTPPAELTTPLSATFVAFFDENADNILQASEVVFGDVTLATDTQLSTLIPAAAAQTLFNALATTSVNYVIAAVVRSPSGNLPSDTSVGIKANLSFTATAALTK
jgi:hypothetical protein